MKGYNWIKQYFTAKKANKEIWFILEEDDACHIIDGTLLSVLLAENLTLTRVNNLHYLSTIDSFRGEDGKIYRKQILNYVGLHYRESLQKNGKKLDNYLVALTELNANTNQNNLVREKNQISLYLCRNLIKRIASYEFGEKTAPTPNR